MAVGDEWIGSTPAEDYSVPGEADLYSVARLNTATKLQKKFQELKAQRFRLEQQWRLNLAFYNSKQWSYIDRLGRLQTLSTDEGDKPRYRVRLVSNQIAPGAQSLLAKLTKTKPVISATPGSASDKDVKAAQMAEDLLEFWWREFNMDDSLEEALLWGIIAGQGFWKITWDKFASKGMEFLLGPDGQPIVDDTLADEWRSRCEQMGIKPQTKTVYLGDIRLQTLGPYNVYLDPAAKVFQDCQYAITVTFMTPDEIYTRWGIRVTPDSVPTDADMALPYDSSYFSMIKTVKAVYEGYFLPNAALPKGRYVAWIASPNKIIQDEPWAKVFPTEELPLVKFPGVRLPGRIYDASITEMAVPLQKELNKTLSQIVEFKNMTIKPRVWAPVGSLRQRLTNEPGAVYEYTPIGGLKPEVEQLPAMPPYVYEHLTVIAQNIKDLFGLTEVAEGTVPPNVEAGVAIDLLQEMSTDRLAPTIKLMEGALGRAGNLMLALAKENYIEPRLLKIRGSGGGAQVKRFTQSDIEGSIDVAIETGSALPRTRAGRQARIESFIQMGLLEPQQAWKYVDMADMKSVSKMFQADEDMATRENEKMTVGEPLNISALQDAMQAVQSGTNPDTGQPFQGPQDVQKFLLDKSLSPTYYENWAIHLDTHGTFMKSVEFERLPPEAQQRVINHYIQTFQLMRQLQPIPQAEAVRTTLSLKGTVGPTVASEVLGRSIPGIAPQQFEEAPLLTNYTVEDRMNVSGSGNPTNPVSPDGITQDYPGMAPIHPQIGPIAPDSPGMQQAMAETQGTNAKTQGAHIDNVGKHISLAQQEEQHQQALRHQEEQHQMKMQQLQEQHAAQLESIRSGQMHKMSEDHANQSQKRSQADEAHAQKLKLQKQQANKPKPKANNGGS